MMEITTVKIEKPEELNFILGQSHFIKTVEDIYEAMVNAVPGAKFGVAFCEASGPCLVRCEGTDGFSRRRPDMILASRQSWSGFGSMQHSGEKNVSDNAERCPADRSNEKSPTNKVILNTNA